MFQNVDEGRHKKETPISLTRSWFFFVFQFSFLGFQRAHILIERKAQRGTFKHAGMNVFFITLLWRCKDERSGVLYG